MENMGKAFGTTAVWGGMAGLSYLFHSFGVLSGEGAGCMVFAGFLITGWMWKPRG